MTYDEIYRQYYTRVSRYLSGIVGPAEAEDLAQDVFIKVGKRLPGLRDPSKLSSWIFKIALNAARDRLRQPRIKKAACERVPAEGKEADAIDQLADSQLRSPEESLLRTEMIQCYLDFVKHLPKNYYEVYEASEFEGLSDKGISEKLSVPLETVKIRLHRARLRLYGELRNHCRCFYNGRGELMGSRK